MAENILEIRFGVAGGGSVDGESGKQIAADLTSIAKSITPNIRFRLASDQQSTFQKELDAIANNLKLNIQANVTSVKMPDGSAYDKGSGGGSGSGGTDKFRAGRTALSSYKKALSDIAAVQKKLFDTRTSDKGTKSEETALIRKLALLKSYAKQQEEIVKSQGSASQKAALAEAQSANALKANIARYDTVISRVKEYAKQVGALDKKYTTQAYQSDVDQVVANLQESSKSTGLTKEESTGRVAQAEALAKAYNDAKKAIEAANAEIAKPVPKLASDADAKAYVQNLSGQVDDAKQKVRDLQRLLADAAKTFGKDKGVLVDAKGFADATSSAERFYARYKQLIQANDEFSKKWDDLLAKVRGSEFKTPTEAKAAVQALIAETERAGVTVESFGQKLKRVFGSNFVAAIAAIASNELRKALREIYNNVVDLDSALTEFSIVSGKTGSDLSKFADQAFEASKRIRAGVTDIIDAATVYSRLGFTDQESLKYAELTTMFSKVGDVEIADAESNITALIKAYDVGADQLEDALDKIVYVGNNFAISSSEIGEGLNNAAASLSANGNTLEQSIALLTAAQVVTQNAAKSSTALRTIAARLTNSTAELEELGESTDDLAVSTAKYREDILALTGVDIQDQSGKFKSTYEILKAIADEWERIGEAGNQEAVATLIAGTRQQPVFYSLMQNFKDANDIIAQLGSNDAAGTMTKSYQTYIDSIRGSLEQIKTTFADLSRNVLSSGMVKTVLNVANALLKIVNYLAKTKALIPSIIAGITTLKLTKGNGLFQVSDGGITNSLSKMRTTLGGVFDQYNDAAKSAGGLTADLSTKIVQLAGENNNLKTYFESLGGSATASFGAYAKQLVGATAKTIGLEAATLALNAALSIGASMLLGVVINAISSAIQKAENARQAAADAAAEFQSFDTSLKTLIDDYKQLYDENGGSWDTDSVSAVKDIQQQITDLVGHQVDNLDLVNGKLEDQLGILHSISVENSREYLKENAYGIRESKKYLEQERTSTMGSGGLLSSNPGEIWIRNNASRFGFSDTNLGAYEITGTADQIIKAYSTMYDELEAYARENGFVDEVENQLARISKALNDVKNSSYQAAKDAYDAWVTNEAVVRQEDQLRDGFADQSAYDTHVAGLKAEADGNEKLYEAMLQVIQVAFPEFAEASKKAADSADSQATGLDYLIKKYHELKQQNEKFAKSGNVDLIHRPQVPQDDGSVATVLTTSQDFVLGDANSNQNVIVHYTPILPDGTLLDDDTAYDYLRGLIDESANAAELLNNDRNGRRIILKVTTDLDYTLSDDNLDAIWSKIGDQYEILKDKYQNGGNDGRAFVLTTFTNIANDLRIPVDEIAKYFASLFKADQWADQLHNAQGEFYDFINTLDEAVPHLGEIVQESKTLQNLLAGMPMPQVLEWLSQQSNGSAKDLTQYSDAVEAISNVQQQLATAKQELSDTGSLTSGTAQDIYSTLITAGKDPLQYLITEGNQIKLNTEAYREFIQEQAYEKNGIADMTRALAEQLALRQQIEDQKAASKSSGANELIQQLEQQLSQLEDTYGNVDELQNAITYLETLFNLDWDTNGVKSGIDGLNDALESAEENANILSSAMDELRSSGNLDNLTETDFSDLISQFPKLKRWLDAYGKGLISATQLQKVFQTELDSFNADKVISSLSTAKDSISTLADIINDLRDDGRMSFGSLSEIQEAFGNVPGFDGYLQKLQNAKTVTEDVTDVIGSLLYQALVDATGSTQKLAAADEQMIAIMLKEAGVANSTAVAHRAVQKAKAESAIASKAAAASSSSEITALLAEAKASGTTAQAIYNLVAQELIFNNSKMDISQKIQALATLTQYALGATGAVNGVTNSLLGGISGASGIDSKVLDKQVQNIIATGKENGVTISRAAAEKQVLNKYWQSVSESFTKVDNPFEDLDFDIPSGGGSAETQAAKIQSAFESLNSTLEHSIYLEQQYYTIADDTSNYDAMRQSLQNQVDYYKQIQTAANAAANKIREYYRSQGLSAEAIEQQSEIQALQKTWWGAANSINEALDKIATAIRDKLSKEIDDIQSAWSNLQKAAEEYSQSGTISVDSLQAIISAGVEYVALLKDENGQLVLNEDAVSSVLEAKTQQLAVESALSYVEQVRNALTQKNSAELARLLDVTSVAASSTWDLVYAQAALLNLDSDQYAKLISNIDKFRSIANTTVQSVKKQINASVTNDSKDYKSALDDVLKYVEELIKYEHEQMVDALEKQKDAYQEIIDKKKEMLQQTKDEEDYESNVSKKLKEIARIQDQINRLSLDDSREAAAKRAQLEQELADLQEDLADYIGDYSTTKNEEALDKSAEDYSDYIDDRIKAVEDEVSSEEKIYKLA